MPAFRDPFEPVALPGEAVRLEPANTVREVVAVEQMASIGPVDVGGAIAAGEDSGIQSLENQLDMNDDTLGQFLLNPISWVEVEYRQTGEQEQRFVNANQVGTINPTTPPEQRLVFVMEQQAGHVIINNPHTYDLQKSLLQFTGFKLVLGAEMSRGEVESLPGEPASVPVDSLKQAALTG